MGAAKGVEGEDCQIHQVEALEALSGCLVCADSGVELHDTEELSELPRLERLEVVYCLLFAGGGESRRGDRDIATTRGSIGIGSLCRESDAQGACRSR